MERAHDGQGTDWEERLRRGREVARQVGGKRTDESVAVVVLNWRRPEETAGCLASLMTLEHRVRTYLVDNESDPEALQALLDRFPAVSAIPNSENLGYAEGMNVGMDRALEQGATHLLLLNNDVRVTPPLIDRLLAIFRLHKDAGIVGPCIRFPEPDGRVESLGIDVNRFSGRVQLRFHGTHPDDVYPYPHKVDAVAGAAMMVSAALVQAVGQFDPGYFAYFEDIDLCLRARARGFASYVSPRAVVYHAGAGTMGDRPERIYYGVRNHLWVVEEHGMPLSRGLRPVRLAYVAALHGFQVVRERRAGLMAGLRHYALGLRDYRTGRLGRCPSEQKSRL